MARDLLADLLICKETQYANWEAITKFVAEARTGWPETIQYAMELEAEIDDLRNEVNILQEQLDRKLVFGYDPTR